MYAVPSVSRRVGYRRCADMRPRLKVARIWRASHSDIHWRATRSVANCGRGSSPRRHSHAVWPVDVANCASANPCRAARSRSGSGVTSICPFGCMVSMTGAVPARRPAKTRGGIHVGTHACLSRGDSTPAAVTAAGGHLRREELSPGGAIGEAPLIAGYRSPAASARRGRVSCTHPDAERTEPARSGHVLVDTAQRKSAVSRVLRSLATARGCRRWFVLLAWLSATASGQSGAAVLAALT